jgi:HD-GYP domain-containing protein (c-di-GMP phosphodiesterase class II)
MRDSKNQLLIFLLGISLGALAGGGFVYSLMYTENKDKVSIKIVPEIVKQLFGLMKTDQQTVDTSKVAVTTAEKTYKKTESTTKNKEFELDKDSDHDQAGRENNFPDEPAEVIEIAKDQMLLKLSVLVLNLDFNEKTKSRQQADSLLQASADVKTDSRFQEKTMTISVELWQNPLNFRGYKFSKNKLILYGIDTEEPLSFYYFREKFYMRWRDKFYELQGDNSFNPYVVATNSQAIQSSIIYQNQIQY